MCCSRMRTITSRGRGESKAERSTSYANRSFNRSRSAQTVLVFPEPQHSPPAAPQQYVRVAVPLNVGFDLVAPPTGIGFRPRGVVRTTVPEAAVDEHRNLDANEGHVRATTGSWKLPVNSVPQTFGVNRGPHRELTWCVSPRRDLHSPPNPERGRGRTVIHGVMPRYFCSYICARR
jgi:hypothetical protein